MTDEELVLLARHGDASAFDQLVVRHHAAVYRAALAALRVREDAEDATQDTFIRAWKTINRFRGEATFKTWLLTIAWNRAVTRRRLRMNWWRRRASAENALVAVTHANGPEDIARGLEMRRYIGMAIEGLSIKLRDALLLTQSGVYSYEEVATMLGIAEGTLKWRVSEARRRVRQRLAALGYVEK